MRIDLSVIMAVLLIAFATAIFLGAYSSRNDTGCTPSCGDLSAVALFGAISIFGGVVSASASRLAAFRISYTRVAVNTGAWIFMIASVASLVTTTSHSVILTISSVVVLASVRAKLEARDADANRN
ncbi:hypothetical protein [Candidatus Lucifugimonas marina]|uniref:Uncharacterized protein n=1 Tax=Candidatus Lucifugimonas marina TaxID=3038979 RepID=A0AAJ5ZDU7_9CHLR|nr:hypothetical protein [SAR202 cluster bacterium JH702]MDG0868526.1 hypothetical protein [SAR202 cluster bacterium JH639]WFG35165.1 hypothetical protein GKN94_05475 [SAR202 cluster bacterium JH545]WFG39115.1 hypothetical protein GKO48_05605 [SAR202 cluster bacterium JH1073]